MSRITGDDEYTSDYVSEASRSQRFFIGVFKASGSLNHNAPVRADSGVEAVGVWAYYALVLAVVVGFVFLMLQLMWVLSGQTQIPLDEIGDALVIIPEG